MCFSEPFCTLLLVSCVSLSSLFLSITPLEFLPPPTSTPTPTHPPIYQHYRIQFAGFCCKHSEVSRSRSNAVETWREAVWRCSSKKRISSFLSHIVWKLFLTQMEQKQLMWHWAVCVSPPPSQSTCILAVFTCMEINIQLLRKGFFLFGQVISIDVCFKLFHGIVSQHWQISINVCQNKLLND